MCAVCALTSVSYAGARLRRTQHTATHHYVATQRPALAFRHDVRCVALREVPPESDSKHVVLIYYDKRSRKLSSKFLEENSKMLAVTVVKS